MIGFIKFGFFVLKWGPKRFSQLQISLDPEITCAVQSLLCGGLLKLLVGNVIPISAPKCTFKSFNVCTKIYKSAYKMH